MATSFQRTSRRIIRRTLRRKRDRAARAIQTLGAIAVLLAVVGYYTFGTLSPCAVLRDTARRFDSVAALLPDAILSQIIETQYGTLSPGRCVAIMLNNHNNTGRR